VKWRRINLAAAVPVLLCVVTAALWVRSYWYFDLVKLAGNSWYCMLEDRTGEISLEWCPHYPWPGYHKTGASTGRITQTESLLSERFTNHRVGGFGLGQTTYRAASPDRKRMADVSFDVVVIPFWFLLTLLSCLLLAIGLSRMRERNRAIDHRCRKCGYDLRATPERCPECGTEVSAADVNAIVKTADA